MIMSIESIPYDSIQYFQYSITFYSNRPCIDDSDWLIEYDYDLTCRSEVYYNMDSD